jgi:hypothetical protein
MRPQDVRPGLPVDVTRKGTTRPGIVAHTARPWVWVSHTDHGEPAQVRVRPASLTRRQGEGR